MDNSTHNNSENLVRYLDGELSGSEKIAVEQQLADDAVLKQEYDNLLATRESIRYYGLQQKVAGIHQQMMGEFQAPVKKINSTRKIIRYSIAVAASLMLLIGGYIAYNFFTLSPNKVFASTYQTYEMITVRDGNNNATTTEKAYREKNYKEVLRIYNAGEDHSLKGEFLCGAAALELDDNSRAIKCFKEVLDANRQSSTTALNDEAEYYLSLSYIKNRDYDLALELMNKIKDKPNHLYHEKITGKLIRQVKMLKWQ